MGHGASRHASTLAASRTNQTVATMPRSPVLADRSNSDVDLMRNASDATKHSPLAAADVLHSASSSRANTTAAPPPDVQKSLPSPSEGLFLDLSKSSSENLPAHTPAMSLSPAALLLRAPSSPSPHRVKLKPLSSSASLLPALTTSLSALHTPPTASLQQSAQITATPSEKAPIAPPVGYVPAATAVVPKRSGSAASSDSLQPSGFIIMPTSAKPIGQLPRKDAPEEELTLTKGADEQARATTTPVGVLATTTNRLNMEATASAAGTQNATSKVRAAPSPSSVREQPTFQKAGWSSIKYDIGDVTLGEGNFSTVKRCTLGEQCAYAMKVAAKFGVPAQVADKEGTKEADAKRELAVLLAVGLHPSMVGLIDRFETNDSFVFVLELVNGGTVFERIYSRGAYSENDAALLMRQLGAALQHLRNVQICHRDIKPENLLLDMTTHRVKLADFGLACFYGVGHPPMRAMVGTTGYAAPEQLDQRERGEYGGEVDLWSSGVLMFVLIGGYHPFDPFDNVRERELKKKIIDSDWGFSDRRQQWEQVSSRAKHVLHGLLEPNPQRRLSAEQLLQSDWIKQTK